MSDFLHGAASLLMVIVATGLFAMWRRRSAADQMMGVQLLGSAGVAILLLLSAAGGETSLLDVALSVALLAAFAAVAFRGVALRGGAGRARKPGTGEEAP